MRYIWCIIICLGTLGLVSVSLVRGIAAQAGEALPLSNPQIYDYDGVAVSPLCFLNNIGTEEIPVYPTRLCNSEGLEATGSTALDAHKFVSVSYEYSLYDDESEENFVTRGFVAYRALGMVDYEGDSYLALWLLENGGGSGTFSTLMLLDYIRDEADKTVHYKRVRSLAFGDRCMGGIVDAIVQEGQLQFYLHTTMADMFLLIDDAERPILKSDAYKDLPFCAACCYAVAEYDLEGLRGVNFPAERHYPDAQNSKNKAANCIEELVDMNSAQGQSYFDTDAFGVFIRELEHVCLGRMEGE